MKKLIQLCLFLTIYGTIANANGYQIGDKAEDFYLKGVDGKMYSLSQYEDSKGFIVIFTCNHCPFAKAYEDRIIAIDKEFKEKGYPVIAINPNDPDVSPEDSFEKMQERSQSKSFTFPYLFDEKQEVYKKFGATRTPHVYVLQKTDDKKLLVRYIGTIDDNYQDESKVSEKYLVNAVESLLDGKEPKPNFTKAIGCSIKKK